MQQVGPVLADFLLQIPDQAGKFRPLVTQCRDDVWLAHVFVFPW